LIMYRRFLSITKIYSKMGLMSKRNFLCMQK
jgi:hypothetical protein